MIDKNKVDPYGEENWDDKRHPIIEFFHNSNVKILGGILLVCSILALFVIIILFVSKKSADNKYNKLYHNEYFTIKYKDPLGHRIIFQRDLDTTYYAQMSADENIFYKESKWDCLWYSKNVGDKLYFDYIMKSRFYRTVNKK